MTGAVETIAAAPTAAVPRKRRPAKAWSASRGAILLLAAPGLVLALFFLLPLGSVFIESLSSDKGIFTPYLRIATDSGLRGSLIYTFQTALIVTFFSLLISYPAAYFISRAQGRLQLALMAFVLIPFWTSAVMRSYAWLVLLQRRGILNEALRSLGIIDQPLRLTGSDLGSDIAMIQIMLPFMILPLISTMRSIDPNVLRAAAILGANPLRQFRHVYLALTLPGVAAGCILVFISTLGFYITPALLGGSSMMISVTIEQQVSRLLDWPLASALSTVLLILTCALFVVYERVTQRLGGKVDRS